MMCGFTGFVDYKKNASSYRNVLLAMNNTLAKRGPDEDGSVIKDHVAVAHKRLIVIDPEGGRQPMVYIHEGNEYIIVYNGQIYNTKELRSTLEENGFEINSHSDTEILLKSYIHFGKNVVKHLNGIFAFAIWNSKKEELFVARDHFGIKPFFYCIHDSTFIFASEIKALFEYPGIEKVIDKQGISELFGLGPAHTPGTTVFKNIFEIKPAHFGIYNKSGLHLQRYWKLENKIHKDSLGQTCEKISYLLDDSIQKQLVSDVPLCVMLSGGLDSSIITAYASNYCKNNGLPPLDTFSVDYVDNDKNFIKSDFQPNSDNYYIDLMVNKFKTNHHKVVIDTPELADKLEEAMIARDCPGMADVDSSFLLFCKYIKNEFTVCLSGECSDEIFAGYPWFFRNDALNSGTFPWSIAYRERQEILNTEIASQVNLKDYIDFRYNESLSDIDSFEEDDKDTAEKRKISYLTINWFMQTLLDRADRCSMYSGLELRVPFCDYRLVEYMWNIPWNLKALGGREKGLLRYLVRDLLPDEIVDRKKSPYPKTHNPTYLVKVKEMLTKIMANPNAPINILLNRNYILNILNTDGMFFTRPWFGQLMTGPQLMAYLCQVNMWLEHYNPKIEL